MWRKTLESLVVLVTLAAGTATPAPGLPAQDNPQVQIQATSRGTPSVGPQELIVDGKVLGKRIKTTSGLVCLVCNQPIGRDDFVFRVKGQRVAVHKVNCYARLLEHPYHFLEILQPHGAFLGAGAEDQVVSFAWFLVGLYILSGLVFGALGAHQALHRGRSAMAWFGLGLTLNFLGYLLLLTRPSRRTESSAFVLPGLRKFHTTLDPRPCPRCGRSNHPSAEQCGGCGAKLQPSFESEVKKAGFKTS